MNYWGMLTQPLIKIFIATPKRQIIPREMIGKIIFVTVKEKFIWEIKEEWINNEEKIKISNIEKTIINCLTYPQYCGGITEITKGIWITKDKVDYKILLNYVNRQNKNVVAKRLNKNSWRLIDNVGQKQIKNVIRF